MPLDTTPYLHPATQGWREPLIRRAAYLRSLNRQFQPDKELEDVGCARVGSLAPRL